MIITIDRAFGCGGLAIAKRLAKHYGLPLLDTNGLLETAQKWGDYDEVQAFLMEKPVNSLIYAIAMEDFLDERAKLPFALIRKAASQQGGVLMGHCGNYIFREDKRAVHVFLHASLQVRAEHIAEKYHLSEKKSRELIGQTDKHRASFHSYYTNEEWGRASGYHICLDCGEHSTEQISELIIRYIECR